MTFHTSIRVRFGDEDRAQVVYFPRLIHLFHCAFEDYFDLQGITYRHCLEVDRIGWPAVNVNVDFRTPLRFGDDFLVDIDVTRLGTKSATFRYRGRVEVNGTPREVAEANITVACIDIDTFQSMAIPDKYRALLTQHLSV